MTKVTIYREAPLNSYYRSLLHLAANKKIELEWFDHKGLEWFVIKLWYRSPIARLLVKKLSGRTPRKKEPTWSELLNSLLYPLRLLRRRNIIVAIAPYSIMGPFFLLLKMLGKNVVYFTSWPYWSDGNYVHRPILGSRQIWGLFLNCLKAVAVTKKGADELSRIGVNARHIPHSVDIRLFVPARNRQVTNLRLLYVGRVVKEKGVMELSRVFESLLGKYPHLELTIVGDGPELQNMKDKKGISCKGYLADEKDLIREYQSSDIFVLNSFEIDGWQEFFGMALIEAMACGLPCVATDCVGPKELVEDGASGFIIPQKDDKSLYHKLECLILDNDLRVQFGTRGREKAIDFAVEKNAENWLEAISG